MAAGGNGPSMRLQLLGPLTLFADGALEPSPVPKGRASTLLALLAANRNHLVGTDQIAATLWPPAGTNGAAQMIASLVSRLRRVVGPALEHHENAYRLHTRGWVVDLDDAERLVRVAERHVVAHEPGLSYAAARRAMQLLAAGPPLEDQQSLSSADDLTATTDALTRRARRAAWVSALAVHDLDAALQAATAAVGANPLDEEAQRAVMRAQYESGEHNAALRTFDRLQRTLRCELGTDPDRATQQLHLRVLRGGPADPAEVTDSTGRAVASVHVVPPRSDPELVGRDEVLSELGRLWRSVALGGSCCVRLVGGLGVGKTELLRRLGHDVANAGGAVLSGRCTSSERSLPMHPLVEAIRHYCASEHHQLVKDAASGIEASLAALVPTLRVALGVADQSTGDVAQERLLDCVQTFATNLAANRPVLVTIDDADLADLDVIALVHRIRVASTSGILVVVTASGDVSSAMIDALGKDAQRLEVDDFTVVEVRALAEHLDVPGVADQVYSLTGGRPALVVEALRAIAQGTSLGELGQSVLAINDVIRGHLRRAGDDVRTVLALAAPLGRRFHFADLLQMGLPLEDAMSAVERALRLRLLEADRDVLVFANGLVHTCVLAELPEPVRHDLVAGARVWRRRRAQETSATALATPGSPTPEGLQPAS